jgi:hypothetical protein
LYCSHNSYTVQFSRIVSTLSSGISFYHLFQTVSTTFFRFHFVAYTTNVLLKSCAFRGDFPILPPNLSTVNNLFSVSYWYVSCLIFSDIVASAATFIILSQLFCYIYPTMGLQLELRLLYFLYLYISTFFIHRYSGACCHLFLPVTPPPCKIFYYNFTINFY